MPTVDADGVRLHYERHGAGADALLFIHGYTGDLNDFRHQIDEFARAYPVLAVDLRGHGKSSAPADRAAYTFDAMIGDVLAIASHAGVERWHLVGHSMGGALAQEIALAHPERTLTLTLNNSTPSFGGNEIAVKFYEKLHQLAEARGMAHVAMLPGLVPPPPHKTQERIDYERGRLAAMSIDAYVGSWMGMQTWAGTRDRVAGISAPTLIACGELDAPHMVKASRWLADRIPNATFELIPQAGHAPHGERPELFNAALRAHLERHAAVSA